MAARTAADRASADDFIVKQDGRRPLFNNAKTNINTNPRISPSRDENIPPGRTKLASQLPRASPARKVDSKGAFQSPAPSRIPRSGSAPTSVGSSGGLSRRKPMSLSEAFQIAGDETAARGIDGSPSPAPRSWRKNASAAEGSRLRQTFNEAGKSPAARLAERTAAAQRTRSEDRLSDVGAANRGFGDDIEGLPKLVPGIDEFPTRRSPMRSPEKSYAWDIDEDFTAGDLQVSNSPMIRVANSSKNSKLTEIQQLEKDHTGEISGLPMPSSARQAISRKVDDIIAKQNTPTPQKKWLASGKAKIDEVQQLEKDGLSRRQYAAARLEEIKELNGMRRSFSPGEQAARRQQDLAPSGSSPGSASKLRGTWRAAQSSLSPPRSDRNVSSEGHRDLLRQLARGTSASPHADNRAAQTTAEDGVTSTSPDSKRNLVSKTDIRASSLRRTSDNDARRVSGGSSTSSTHPARQVVGFTGLWGGKSRSSSGSSKSKRSSMNSESDPTARLDSEMKLFAPADNYSERGSQRAPSPMPEDEEEDERAADATPKPTKPDPLSMPTPQIVGAYVETPVTARTARQTQPRSRSKLREAHSATTDMENVFLDKPNVEESPSKPLLSREDTIRAARDAKPARQTRPKSQQSRSRSRSASRSRPALRNTAALPTARQDLLDLQAMHDMDDATIEDLERIFASNKELMAGDILKVVQDLPATEDELDDIVKREGRIQLKREASVEAAFEKMNKDMAKAMPNVDQEVASLKEVLQAEKATRKVSAEKAARKVSAEKAAQVKIEEPSPKPILGEPQKAPKHTDETQHHHHKHVLSQECPLCVAAPKQGSIIAYIHFPIPRFYHRQPSFRLTLLGLIVTVLSVWYAAESAACAKYCRPQVCTPNAPCVWSFDDPTFGYAMPVKADQWITGGKGRAVTNHLVEEARDWIADLADAALGRSIQNVDTSNMSFEAKRRLRRRMGKKGLLTPPREPSPETKAKWEGWQRERVARENQRSYYEEAEAVGEDERVW